MPEGRGFLARTAPGPLPRGEGVGCLTSSAPAWPCSAMARIVPAAFRSRPSVCPQAAHRKVRSANPSLVLALDPHSAQVIVVYAGGTSTTFRPARLPRSIRIRFVVPMAASAALRAMVDLVRNFGLKSSTAISWWWSTTVLAQTWAVWVFCRAAFLWSFAV